jgi:hypothetical protein
LPASISERASGIDTGAMSTQPATRSCSAGRPGAVGRHPGQRRRVDLEVGEKARDGEMPDCRPASVPDALYLPGVRLHGVETVLHRLPRRIGAHLEARRVGVDERERLYDVGASSVRPCQCIIVISTVMRPIV